MCIFGLFVFGFQCARILVLGFQIIGLFDDRSSSAVRGRWAALHPRGHPTPAPVVGGCSRGRRTAAFVYVHRFAVFFFPVSRDSLTKCRRQTIAPQTQ